MRLQTCVVCVEPRCDRARAIRTDEGHSLTFLSTYRLRILGSTKKYHIWCGERHNPSVWESNPAFAWENIPNIFRWQARVLTNIPTETMDIGVYGRCWTSARKMHDGLTSDGFDVKTLDIKKTDLPWQLPISLPRNRTRSCVSIMIAKCLRDWMHV